MLAAHLVPGYFTAVKSQPHWQRTWGRNRRLVLWAVALTSTFAPDLDVLYNGFFRGFFNHSLLWTHSLFVHLTIGLLWLILWRTGRWPFLQMLVGLAALGGFSHLFLDTISHGTMLLYPLSRQMFLPPYARRALEGGSLAYMTEPIFLAEPLLFALALADWIISRHLSSRVTRMALAGVAGALILFATAFLLLLPRLQSWVAY